MLSECNTVQRTSQLSKCLDAKQRESSEIIVTMALVLSFIRKDLAIALSYKMQFIFQLFQVFFGIAVIYFIGKMVSSGGSTPLLKQYGADYFAFAIVGLAINSYMKAGILTVTNDLRQSMNQGILESLCATPVRYWMLLFYSTIWPFVFETFRIGIYFIFGYIFFDLSLPQANWCGGLLVLLFTIPIFVMLGIISCSILVVIKRGDPVNWFFSSISGILAGTMFPISVFPKWLHSVALCLPLTHSLEAMRRCLLTGSDLSGVKLHLLVLIGFVLSLAPLTIIVNKICMNRARQQGSFGSY